MPSGPMGDVGCDSSESMGTGPTSCDRSPNVHATARARTRAVSFETVLATRFCVDVAEMLRPASTLQRCDLARCRGANDERTVELAVDVRSDRCADHLTKPYMGDIVRTSSRTSDGTTREPAAAVLASNGVCREERDSSASEHSLPLPSAWRRSPVGAVPALSRHLRAGRGMHGGDVSPTRIGEALSALAGRQGGHRQRASTRGLFRGSMSRRAAGSHRHGCGGQCEHGCRH